MSSTSGEWRPTSRRAKREAGNDTIVTHEEVRPKLLRQGQGFGAQAPDPLKAGTLLLRLLRFLRERPVVLLDRLAEPFRHLIGSRQRQRLVARLGVPPQHELELLQLVDRRRLQLLESARVGVDLIGVELPELPEHFIQIARLDAGGLQLTPQRLGIVRPLTELAAPLADVVRVPAAVAAAVVTAPVARVAAIATRGVRRPGVVAVPRAAAILPALRVLALRAVRTF